MKTLAMTVTLLALGTASVWADGGGYFSGPGRSPSYGPAAVANGFGGGSNHSNPITTLANWMSTHVLGQNCCYTDPATGTRYIVPAPVRGSVPSSSDARPAGCNCSNAGHH